MQELFNNYTTVCSSDEIPTREVNQQQKTLLGLSISFWFFFYSVIHISIHPSKELCSKMAPGEVGVSLP